MDIAKPISAAISSISFSHLSSNEIRQISVKQVLNTTLFNNLNRPNAGAMYDPVFGPLEKGDMYVLPVLLSSSGCAAPLLPS